MPQKKIDFFLQTKRKREADCPLELNHNDIYNGSEKNQESAGNVELAEQRPSELSLVNEAAEAEEASSAATTKENYTKGRTVKSEWFKLFPWLIHDKLDKVFRCKDCIESKLKNIFVTGKSAEKPKKDDLRKHEKTEDHRRASQALSRSKAMKGATLTANEKAKGAVIAAMRTVLCLAQEDIPSSKTQSIITLQIANGSSQIMELKTEGGSIQYVHHDSIADMQKCLASVMEEELLSEVKNAEFFSLEADEATDSANKSILIVYVRYIKDCKPISRFFGVKELQNTRANEIVRVLDELIQEKGLDITKLVGMATDGASVMRGTCKGVVTQFKKKAPFMVANHCMAHRLQLASQKAANQVKEVERYISILNKLARCLKFSAKLDRVVENAKEVNDEQGSKVKQIFFTRWLSFADSTHALAGCIPSMISALYEAAADTDDREASAQLLGLAEEMATIKFIKLTHFLADTAGYLAILNKAMQVANPTYEHVKQQIDACIVAIQSLQTHPGPYMSKVNDVFPDTAPAGGYTEWGTHSIKDKQKQREKYDKSVVEFTDAVVFRLETTFPDRDSMAAFSVFSGEENGGDALDKLVKCYGTDKKVGAENLKSLVNSEEAKKEWKFVQPIAATYHNMAHLYERFLVSHQEAYPNICRLVSIGLTIPVTSVNCERGVSRYNAIKTDSRSRMNIASVEQLIILSSESAHFTEYDYQRAWEKWLGKGRRGLKPLEKRCKESDTLVEMECDTDKPLDLSKP